jgi:hypothetical protein
MGKNMNRREALRTMVAAGITVPFGIPILAEKSKAEYSLITKAEYSLDDFQGYTFARRVELIDGSMWNIYVKQELATPIIMHQETFKPYRPLKPIFMEKQIAVRDDYRRIKVLPTVITKNQHVLCYNIEDVSERQLIVT